MNSLFPWLSTFYSKIVENWNENSNKCENRGAKVFDIVEIPGCSDPFRRLFSTGERILLQDLESTRSVEHSDEKHSDGAIKNGKMPVQKRVENYSHD